MTTDRDTRLRAFIARYNDGQDIGEAVGLESDAFIEDIESLMAEAAAVPPALDVERLAEAIVAADGADPSWVTNVDRGNAKRIATEYARLAEQDR